MHICTYSWVNTCIYVYVCMNVILSCTLVLFWKWHKRQRLYNTAGKAFVFGELDRVLAIGTPEALTTDRPLEAGWGSQGSIYLDYMCQWPSCTCFQIQWASSPFALNSSNTDIYLYSCSLKPTKRNQKLCLSLSGRMKWLASWQWLLLGQPQCSLNVNCWNLIIRTKEQTRLS